MTILRLLNLIVIAALVLAAAYVYRVKFEATQQAEQLARLRTEIRREREAIAALRAEWARLDSPARIQGLAQRHLPLKPVASTQIDSLGALPERPPDIVPPGTSDPIGAMIENLEDAEFTTGTLPARAEVRAERR
jgi:cell division protein FtsL